MCARHAQSLQVNGAAVHGALEWGGGGLDMLGAELGREEVMQGAVDAPEADAREDEEANAPRRRAAVLLGHSLAHNDLLRRGHHLLLLLAVVDDDGLAAAATVVLPHHLRLHRHLLLHHHLLLEQYRVHGLRWRRRHGLNGGGHDIRVERRGRRYYAAADRLPSVGIELLRGRDRLPSVGVEL